MHRFPPPCAVFVPVLAVDLSPRVVRVDNLLRRAPWPLYEGNLAARRGMRWVAIVSQRRRAVAPHIWLGELAVTVRVNACSVLAPWHLGPHALHTPVARRHLVPY